MPFFEANLKSPNRGLWNTKERVACRSTGVEVEVHGSWSVAFELRRRSIGAWRWKKDGKLLLQVAALQP